MAEEKNDTAPGTDVLSRDCFRMSYSLSWLPQSRALDKADKNEFAVRHGGSGDGYSLSKRLFTAKHPVVKKLNAARSRFGLLRERYTIVVCQKVAGGKYVADPGLRLIHRDDVDKFDRQFRALADDLYSLVDEADRYLDRPYSDGRADYPSIKDMDRQLLGTKFSEADYPRSLRDRISVTMPSYEIQEVSLKLPPEVLQRERDRVAKLMETTLDGAAAHVAESLLETFGSVASQLSNRRRVHPVKSSAHAGLENGEVVAEGLEKKKYAVRISLDGKADEDAVIRRTEFDSKEAFEAEMRPLATGEKRRLTAGTVETLERKLQDFESIRKMLGDHGKGLDEVLSGVRQLVKNRGGAEGAVSAMRKNEAAREAFRSTLESSVASITQYVEKLQGGQVRRQMELD